MALPIHVPRINNNDDEVKLISLEVAKGDKVSPGQVVAQVETDKAVLDVEAPAGGFVLEEGFRTVDARAEGSIRLARRLPCHWFPYRFAASGGCCLEHLCIGP